MDQDRRSDAEELRRLAALTSRPSVVAWLQQQAEAWSPSIASIDTTPAVTVSEPMGQATATDAASEGARPAPTVAGNTTVYERISRYALDQSVSAVKVFITLPGVDSLPAEALQTDADGTSVSLLVHGLKNRNYRFKLELAKEVKPREVSYKVKGDRITLLLPKATSGQWQHITRAEAEEEAKRKEKTAKRTDKDAAADPSAGIMDLMRDLYDDGDDEMKRTIAKAWSESRSKQGLE